MAFIVNIAIWMAIMVCQHLDAALAGGRPNAFSEGQNAFAGIVNPANAVWIRDRLDIGGFWIHQKSSLNNVDGNPFFPKGKIDTAYRVNDLFSGDMAIHKVLKAVGSEVSFSLATYTTPSFTETQTKEPLPLVGTTPIYVKNKTQVISAVLSYKAFENFSVGVSIDYFRFTHKRNGFQRSDNPLRSVSPGHVTNKGNDFSGGIGFTLGWRWNITKTLCFGAALAKKSYCGSYRKYRGYEPHHAKNYVPETFGAGFRYFLTSKLAGRLEVLWSNLGNLPGANDNFLTNGEVNRNLRGSTDSPGPGLQDATFINVGLGYQFSKQLSVGTGLSHRLKHARRNNSFLSQSYTRGVIYDLLSFGVNFNTDKHNLFFSFAYGFENNSTGTLPVAAGGGRMNSRRRTTTCSLSWGYLY